MTKISKLLELDVKLYYNIQQVHENRKIIQISKFTINIKLLIFNRIKCVKKLFILFTYTNKNDYMNINIDKLKNHLQRKTMAPHILYLICKQVIQLHKN